jgi:hypothetical protein
VILRFRESSNGCCSLEIPPVAASPYTLCALPMTCLHSGIYAVGRTTTSLVSVTVGNVTVGVAGSTPNSANW